MIDHSFASLGVTGQAMDENLGMSMEALQRAFFQGGNVLVAQPSAGSSDDLASAVRFLEATSVRNALSNAGVSDALTEFVRAARHTAGDRLQGAFVGFFDGVVYVWIIIPDVDVALTRELFLIRDAIADRHSSDFEIHVRPSQGRSIEDLLPGGFRPVSM